METNKSNRSLLAMLASNQSEALISAGYPASDLISAGYSASDLISAGYPASALRKLEAEIPTLEKPYTALWNGIQTKARKFSQSTWGPDTPPAEAHICDTAMCTAGSLVNMAGEAGYALKEKYGWKTAGALIHYKAHPDWPCQNFGAIPDAWALAYIEEMAEREAAEAA